MILLWLTSALSFLLLSYLVPGITVAGLGTALFVAFLWGVFALTIRPLLLLLTLPINIITLGLFTFVINALLLLFLGSMLEGFEVASFGSALLGALVLAGLQAFFVWLFESRKPEDN